MKSLRLRLALISATISGVVVVAFGMAGWFLTARILQESIDLRLEVPLDRIVRDLHPRTDIDRVIHNLDISFSEDVSSGTRRILLLDRDGSELYRTPDDDWVSKIDTSKFEFESVETGMEKIQRRDRRADMPHLDRASSQDPGNPPPPPPPPGPPGERQGPRPGPHPERGLGLPPRTGSPPVNTFYTLSDAGKQWRVGVIQDRGYVALMATDLADYRAEVQRIRRLFFFVLPVCLLLIGLGGWLVADRALRPVDLIAKTASRVTAHGLDERIPKEVHDYEELSDLVDVLNEMMDRLENSFRHAIRFSADVAHELKTPLTVMQVAVQDAIKECESGSREEETLLTVSYEADRLKRITRSLMLLAQADSGQLQIRREVFSFSKEVEAVCEDAEILCEKAGLQFEADIEADITVNADPVLLRQAMQNLVSNAVKYNQAKGSVHCRLYREASEIVFEVSNTGPGIEEGLQEKIFERFYRVDQARSRVVDGFGLGLNLAWESVHVMGGDLLLVESNDQITRFQLRLKDKKSKRAGNDEK